MVLILLIRLRSGLFFRLFLCLITEIHLGKSCHTACKLIPIISPLLSQRPLVTMLWMAKYKKLLTISIVDICVSVRLLHGRCFFFINIFKRCTQRVFKYLIFGPLSHDIPIRRLFIHDDTARTDQQLWFLFCQLISF